MKTTSLPELPVRIRLNHKLNPTRFPRMTEVMAAIIGHLLDIDFIDPAIAEITVTSDGFVLARANGESSANHFIGNYADLLRNWLNLLIAAGLTTTERVEAESLFARKIGYFVGGNREN